MSAYTDAQRAEAIALVEGCVLVSEVRARLLPVIAERDMAVTEASSARYDVVAEERRTIAARAERDAALVSVGGLQLALASIERQRDEVRCLLFDLVGACADTPMVDSPAWQEACAYVTGARVSRG